MKDVYRKQIDAILDGDREVLDEMYDRAVSDYQNVNDNSLAYVVWLRTGDHESTSIFSTLPGCAQCLTQVKLHCDNTREQMFYNGLNLEFDELIPKAPPTNWNPTEEVLERFAKLQELAETVVVPEKE